MQQRIFQFIIIITFAFFASQTSMAAGTPIQKMAKIMINLNHYPGSDEKEILAGIVKNKQATEQERVMAQAIINLQHKATAADKTKLSVIMNDSAASADTRDLAKIINNLNHMPGSDDKARLKKMF